MGLAIQRDRINAFCYSDRSRIWDGMGREQSAVYSSIYLTVTDFLTNAKPAILVLTIQREQHTKTGLEAPPSLLRWILICRAYHRIPATPSNSGDVFTTASNSLVWQILLDLALEIPCLGNYSHQPSAPLSDGLSFGRITGRLARLRSFTGSQVVSSTAGLTLTILTCEPASAHHAIRRRRHNLTRKGWP